MPQTQSRRKDIRQAEKHHARNRALKLTAKKAARAVLAAAEEGDSEQVGSALSVAYKAIDKAAKAGVIHPNTAARRKSRLAREAAAAQ